MKRNLIFLFAAMVLITVIYLPLRSHIRHERLGEFYAQNFQPVRNAFSTLGLDSTANAKLINLAYKDFCDLTGKEAEAIAKSGIFNPLAKQRLQRLAARNWLPYVDGLIESSLLTAALEAQQSHAKSISDLCKLSVEQNSASSHELVGYLGKLTTNWVVAASATSTATMIQVIHLAAEPMPAVVCDYPCSFVDDSPCAKFSLKLAELTVKNSELYYNRLSSYDRALQELEGLRQKLRQP
jgi:hypothetical protein